MASGFPELLMISSRSRTGHEGKDTPDAVQAVFQRRHGEERELGPALKREDGQYPPAPGRPVGAGLQRKRTESRLPSTTRALFST